jgi:beta-glucosidase
MMNFKFPDNFIWGAATSSYQIEGAYDEDGKGLSTWDVFSRRTGKITNGDTGDFACDHYHLYKDDVKIMKDLGLKAYRFSISWPRILPSGEGEINNKGMDFYDNLIDELLDAGITPFLTLFHWDFPQALEDKYGGWRNKEVSKLFADYSSIIAGKFSDRVKHFTTINEIECHTIIAHKMMFNERHAPGKTEPDKVVNQIVHNALLAHGLSCQAIRSNSGSDVLIGYADNPKFVIPVEETEENKLAAVKAFEILNSQILFPIMIGGYNEHYLKKEEGNLPQYTDDEMKIISTPLDYIGYNYYSARYIKASQNADGFEFIEFPESFPKTSLNWPITPKGIYYMFKFHKHFFNDIPVYITENGCATHEDTTKPGEIYDLDRIEYLRQHLQSINLAMNDGVNIKGYFAWSLLDNFEWAYGYSEKFGLVGVNFTNMKRTVKLSGKYYRDVIKNNCVV